jgi:hypothetical protein
LATEGFKLAHVPPDILPESVTLEPLQVVIVELPPEICKEGGQYRGAVRTLVVGLTIKGDELQLQRVLTVIGEFVYTGGALNGAVAKLSIEYCRVVPTGQAVRGALIDPSDALPKRAQVLSTTTAAGAGAVRTGQHADTVTVAVTVFGQMPLLTV